MFPPRRLRVVLTIIRLMFRAVGDEAKTGLHVVTLCLGLCWGLEQKLLDYVVMHFKTEEDMFAKVNYADTAAHKAIHDKFVQDALAVKAVDDGVIQFLKSWLVNHIKGTDMKYVDVLKAL